MSDKQIHIMRARRQFPISRGDDPYDGVQVDVLLSYLKGEPIVAVRLSEDQALTLAAELLGAIQAVRQYGKRPSAPLPT